MIHNSPKTLSILLIEDNPADRRLAEIALDEAAMEGHMICDLRTAGTLAEGLACLQEATCGVILIDLDLPDAKGLDGVRRLHAAYPDIPIVVLTGLSDQSLTMGVLEAGAGDYLEKSDMRPKALLRTLRYAIERKAMECRLVELAETDSLTGLLNRRAFLANVEVARLQAAEGLSESAILLIDLDRFKDINDLFGHQTGDEVLVAIADAIKTVLSENDSAARIGGDEFAVLLRNVATEEAAFRRTDEILAALKAICMLNDGRFGVHFSVGVSLISYGETETSTLISRADHALYKSKQTKDTAVVLYDAQMDASFNEKQVLKQKMAADIQQNRFYLDFQPIVDAGNHSIVAAEGLARWRGEDGALVGPVTFIPIAEESGMIATLGGRLFEDLCACISKRFSDQKNVVIPISINVSPIQARDPGFAVRFINTIERHAIPPQYINIELTESSFVHSIDVVQTNLEMIRHYGVGVQIDDFGTGYSSLSLLKDLPFDAVKIDRSFVQDVGKVVWADAIVKALVDMGENLGFRTIAEGIETEEQALALRDLGVTCLQGYYFSRPISREAFATLLSGDGYCNVA
ncbi:MAG: EAL domain-containing protein [Rhizobiaceae bacterium]|nr:EAL domain-containing protein [Rhizobiaceae bacterium]